MKHNVKRSSPVHRSQHACIFCMRVRTRSLVHDIIPAAAHFICVDDAIVCAVVCVTYKTIGSHFRHGDEESNRPRFMLGQGSETTGVVVTRTAVYFSTRISIRASVDNLAWVSLGWISCTPQAFVATFLRAVSALSSSPPRCVPAFQRVGTGVGRSYCSHGSCLCASPECHSSPLARISTILVDQLEASGKFNESARRAETFHGWAYMRSVLLEVNRRTRSTLRVPRLHIWKVSTFVWPP